MTIEYDTFSDWQMGHGPAGFIETISDYLVNNPDRTVGITLATGEVESVLLLIGKEIIRASVIENGFAPMGVIASIA